MIFSKECMNKFVPYKILHEMDFASGTLSYKEIEVLQMAEGLWNYECGVLPSSSTLKHVAEVVESATNDHMPIMVNHDENSITFDFERMLNSSLKHMGCQKLHWRTMLS